MQFAVRLLKTEETRLGLGTHREGSQLWPARPQKSPPALPHTAHQGHTNQEIDTEVPVKPPALAGSVLKSGLLTELGSWN